MTSRKSPGDKLEGSLHEVEIATLSPDGEIVKQSVKGTLDDKQPFRRCTEL
ncbi:MAG: hypothetical protein CM15mP3_04080 [Candidatus Poseidoniales archaeon]|nr:MAG: hypothetical protein CM15mP3_04080 [Candidatus Poseidoniales archaeon]